MLAPNYIQKGLKAIDKMYFAVFNPCILEGKNMSWGRGRWQVRKWTGVYPKRPDLWDIESDVIFTICKEEMTDEGLVDVGYEEIDERAISAIGESNYWKAQWKKNLQDMDWRNERRSRLEKAQLEYESKCAAKSIWRNYHEPTVHLSGKDWAA